MDLVYHTQSRTARQKTLKAENIYQELGSHVSNTSMRSLIETKFSESVEPKSKYVSVWKCYRSIFLLLLDML